MVKLIIGFFRIKQSRGISLNSLSLAIHIMTYHIPQIITPQYPWPENIPPLGIEYVHDVWLYSVNRMGENYKTTRECLGLRLPLSSESSSEKNTKERGIGAVEVSCLMHLPLLVCESGCHWLPLSVTCSQSSSLSTITVIRHLSLPAHFRSLPGGNQNNVKIN